MRYSTHYSKITKSTTRALFNGEDPIVVARLVRKRALSQRTCSFVAAQAVFDPLCNRLKY